MVEAQNQTGACAYSYGMHWDSVEFVARHGYVYQRNRQIPDAGERLDAFLKRINAQCDRGEDEFDKHVRPELAQLIESMHAKYMDSEAPDSELGSYLGAAEHFMKRSARLHWRATTSEWYMGHFFRQRVERFYDSIRVQDLVDMVYSKSLMSAEREKLYEMVDLVQADPELSDLFSRFRFDRIIAARLGRMGTTASQELVELMSAYSAEYGWYYNGEFEDGALHRPGAVTREECVGRIRRYLHVSTEEYRTNLRQVAANAERLRATGLEHCQTDEDRAAFEMAVRAGEILLRPQSL